MSSVMPFAFNAVKLHVVNWPRYSQKLDLYINEERMINLLGGIQQPIAKELAE